MTGDTTAEIAQGQTVLSYLAESTRRLVAGEPSDEAEEAVKGLFPSGHQASEYLVRFGALVVLSSLIAAFGLLADSSAVVIGAMLVAPLMTPILAASAALVRAENRRLFWAIGVIGGGTVLAVLVGWLVTFVAAPSLGQGLDLSDEVRSRTLPGLLDLGIAVAAGAAAGYVLPRRNTLAALPGVGIAVALVPPLAAAGVALQLGLTDEAKGAMLLYGTNLAAIIFSASLLLVFAGFRPTLRARRSLIVRLLVTAVVVVIVAIPLTLHTRAVFDDNQLRLAVARSIPEWDDTVEATSVLTEVVDGVAVVEIQLAGPHEPLPAWELAERIRERFGGPVELNMLYERVQEFEVSTR
ncbi:MAG: DUF389 domain-containing protein [Acidimicrobiales bacterium]